MHDFHEAEAVILSDCCQHPVCECFQTTNQDSRVLSDFERNRLLMAMLAPQNNTVLLQNKCRLEVYMRCTNIACMQKMYPGYVSDIQNMKVFANPGFA